MGLDPCHNHLRAALLMMIDLAQAGFAVFAVADAMSSRAASSVALAEARMRQQGVEVVNTEMVVFELLGKAGTAEFRDLSALIR